MGSVARSPRSGSQSDPWNSATGVRPASAMVADGGDELVVYYTGHRWANGVNEDEGNDQVQMMATSTDGIHFEKHGVMVEGPSELPHFRDPKVGKMGDTWYMVFGACSVENRGQVWLYTSKDMRDWEFDRILFEDPDPNVFMLECPDMYPLNDKWVIAYCPMGLIPNGYEHRNVHNAGYVTGSWAPGEDFVQETEYATADWGHNYYAPQTFEAPDGRRIVYGWMGSFHLPLAPQEEDGWAGQLTVPRELSLVDGHQVAVPIEELKQLRVSTDDRGAFVLDREETLVLSQDAGPVEIEAEFDLDASTADRFGFLVHKTGGGHTYISYDDLAHRVAVDRRQTGKGSRGLRGAPAGPGGILKLRIYVDNGSVGVFVNDGEETITSFSLAAEGPRSIELTAEGGNEPGTVIVNDLKIHKLKTIWEDPED